SMLRAKRRAGRGLHHGDCGTSGGIAGLERGYCLMIGGEADVVRRLDSIFVTLAAGAGSTRKTPGREGRGGTAEQGYLHCGPHGAGHFVKMIHNGIEYGMMAAFAEGLNILKHAGVGKQAPAADAETTPLRDPAAYQYDLDLPDITEVWRRGSVIASWLLDLTAAALATDPALDHLPGRAGRGAGADRGAPPRYSSRSSARGGARVCGCGACRRRMCRPTRRGGPVSPSSSWERAGPWISRWTARTKSRRTSISSRGGGVRCCASASWRRPPRARSSSSLGISSSGRSVSGDQCRWR